MGVYINIEMPPNCSACWALDDYGDYPRCRITEEQRGYNFPVRQKRMDKCPFIPIPAHGRLVDARKMFLPFVIKGQRSKRYHLGEKWELNGAEIREVIDSLPTIIPAEEDTDIQKKFIQNWHEDGEQ